MLEQISPTETPAIKQAKETISQFSSLTELNQAKKLLEAYSLNHPDLQQQISSLILQKEKEINKFNEKGMNFDDAEARSAIDLENINILNNLPNLDTTSSSPQSFRTSFDLPVRVSSDPVRNLKCTISARNKIGIQQTSEKRETSEESRRVCQNIEVWVWANY